MIDFQILSLMTFLPLVGALFILSIRGEEALVTRNARFAALYTSLFNLALSIFLLSIFDGSSGDSHGSRRSVSITTWVLTEFPCFSSRCRPS